jgi:hypothetical protein
MKNIATAMPRAKLAGRASQVRMATAVDLFVATIANIGHF